MFTGIVQEMGKIDQVEGHGSSLALVIRATQVLGALDEGDSVAVNGVCLTVTGLEPGRFAADVMPETFRRTNLGNLGKGASVNLERAMRPGDRLDGHIVQGHVDGVGRLKGIRRESIATVFEISASNEIMRYLVLKDSVAVDGISLTVARTGSGVFSVSVIPRTLDETTLQFATVGDPVNLEVNMLGKYVEHFLQQRHEAGLSLETLTRKGFQ